MLLSAIKEQLKHVKSEMSLDPPADSKYYASYQMRVNEARAKAEKLAIDYKDVLINNVYVTLVHAPKFEEDFASSLIFNHKAFAQKLAAVAIPSLKMGTQMSAYQITPMNNMLEEICLDLGVNTQFSPRLNMDLDYAKIIDTPTQFVNLAETLVERQLKNLASDEEGHTFQVLYVQKELRDRTAEIELPDGRIDIIVFVPSLSRSLIAEYHRLFKNPIKTVSFTDTKADSILTSSSDLTVLFTEILAKDVTKGSSKTNVKKKKV